MLKMMGKGTKNGKDITFVIIGLSHRNLAELKKEHPIIIKEGTIGVPDLEVLIFSGETEREMTRMMHELIGPDTEVHIDPRLRD